jgi:hypothetical protein
MKGHGPFFFLSVVRDTFSQCPALFVRYKAVHLNESHYIELKGEFCCFCHEIEQPPGSPAAINQI